jgi:hypothetical protein
MPRRTPLTNFGIRERSETPTLAARITLALTQRQLEILTRIAAEQDRPITYIIRAGVDAMIAAYLAESETPNSK